MRGLWHDGEPEQQQRDHVGLRGGQASQNSTAVLGSHTSTETVGALALQYAGLERSFHLQIPE